MLVINPNQLIPNCCRLHGWVASNVSQVWLCLAFKISTCLYPQGKEEFVLIGKRWCFIYLNTIVLKPSWSSDALHFCNHIYSRAHSSESVCFKSSRANLEAHPGLEIPVQWICSCILKAEEIDISSCLPLCDLSKYISLSIHFFRKQREAIKYLFLGMYGEG